MVDLKSIPLGMVRLAYWVEFYQRMGRASRWMNVLKDEDNEDKVWASVKQLRCWHHAHRVHFLRYDPLLERQSERLQFAEWNREGVLVTPVVGRSIDLPEWMLRDVEPEDRIEPPTRT